MNIEVSRTNKVSIDNIHKATATVGRDTIEDVEYLEFEHSGRLGLNEPEFTLWDKITIPFYRIKHKVKRMYWEARYGFQRMFKGYDSVDTFEIFDKFIERYTKIITEFRNNHWGYPYNLTEEEWDNVLDEMLYHLHYMEEDNVIEELKKDVPKSWNPSHKNINEIMEKHKDEFFKLFSEYFFHLWD